MGLMVKERFLMHKILKRQTVFPLQENPDDHLAWASMSCVISHINMTFISGVML